MVIVGVVGNGPELKLKYVTTVMVLHSVYTINKLYSKALLLQESHTFKPSQSIDYKMHHSETRLKLFNIQNCTTLLDIFFLDPIPI